MEYSNMSSLCLQPLLSRMLGYLANEAQLQVMPMLRTWPADQGHMYTGGSIACMYCAMCMQADYHRPGIEGCTRLA